MPENVAQATLKVQVTGVNQGSNAVKGFQETVTRSMTASEKSVASAIGGMIAQYASMAVAVRQAAKVMSSGIEFNKFVENQTMSFSVMMKSMSAAKEQMKSLYDFAVNSPLTFKETAGSAKQLMAYGFAAKELVPTMKTLGSVAIATGNSLDDISYVYGTLRSQGRAYSRDLMQFGMRGIPIYEELAKVMGVSADQIQKMASQGKIGFKEVEKAFQNMTAEGGRFSGILDGYMETLTGKMSMLSDIWEQSTGKLMEGVTANIKQLVDDLTQSLGSDSFQGYIKNLGEDLANVAGALFTMAEVLIKLLPLLTAFLKLWLAIKAINIAGAILKSIPELLLNISGGMMSFSAGLSTMPMLFDNITASVQLLGDGFKVLFASLATNPIALALLGLTALAAGAVAVSKGISGAAASRNQDIGSRKASLAMDLANAGNSVGAGWMNPADIARLAEQYSLTETVVAQIAIDQKSITEEQWKSYQTQLKNTTDAKAYAKALSEAKNYQIQTTEEKQQQFLSELLGRYKDVSKEVYKYNDALRKSEKTLEIVSELDMNFYRKSANDQTAGAKGGSAARDYLTVVQQTFDEFQLSWGAAYDEDKIKENLESAIASIQTALDNGRLVEGLFDNTTYDEELQAAKKKYQDMLDALGKKSKEVFKELGTWWPPIVKAAEATLTAMDNIDVSTSQALENAEKEYAERRKTLETNRGLASSSDEVLSITQELMNLDADRLKLQQLITEEGKKQANLSTYNTALGGSESYWTDMQAKAGKSYGKVGKNKDGEDAYKSAYLESGLKGIAQQFGKDMKLLATGAKGQFTSQMLQGTEVGNIKSARSSEGLGAGMASMAAQAVTAFASMIMSIENVSKVLNPFQTIFESAKVIIEPLLNNALKPLVQILTQVGTVVGQMLTPFIGVIKIVSSLIYGALAPLIGILNIFGGMLEWVYNTSIIPLGNGIIAVINMFIAGINGFIKGINWAFRWAGVHINTLEYIDDLQATTEALADLTNSIENQKNALNDTISYLTDKINKAVDKQLSSLQDLYEVGAITASDYSSQAELLNLQKIVDQGNVSAEDMALTGQDIYSRLYTLYGVKDALNDSNLTEQQIAKLLTDARLSPESAEARMQRAVASAAQAYASANAVALGPLLSPNIPKSAPPTVVTSIPEGIYNATDQVSDAFTKTQRGFFKNLPIIGGWFDSGTSNIPHDMNARVHRGEGIVPATFMDSIRSGELSLSGGKDEPSGQSINVYVTVQGSVQAENDLADSIANKIYVRRSTGVLTV